MTETTRTETLTGRDLAEAIRRALLRVAGDVTVTEEWCDSGAWFKVAIRDDGAEILSVMVPYRGTAADASTLGIDMDHRSTRWLDGYVTATLHALADR